MFFDLRERETIWTDENKARLVKMAARDTLDISLEEVDRRLLEIRTFVPNIEESLGRI